MQQFCAFIIVMTEHDLASLKSSCRNKMFLLFRFGKYREELIKEFAKIN